MRADLNPEETAFLAQCTTPAQTQAFLDSLSYNWEADGRTTLRSFRRVLRDRTAHCLEGAVAAAGILGHQGYPPLILYLDARDICHMLFIYRQKGRLWGAVSKSRDPNLGGRPPIYRTVWDLAMSYDPYYYNYFTGDKTDLTLRGYATMQLDHFGKDWLTSDEELLFIEAHTWVLKYRALFPRNRRWLYQYTGTDAEIVWL